MIFCDLGGVIPPKCHQDAKHTTTKRMADAPTNAAFRQCPGAFGTASSAGLRRAGCVLACELSAGGTWTPGWLSAASPSANATSPLYRCSFSAMVTIKPGAFEV